MQQWKWQNEMVVCSLKLLEPTNMSRKFAPEENSLLLSQLNMKEMMIQLLWLISIHSMQCLQSAITLMAIEGT